MRTFERFALRWGMVILLFSLHAEMSRGAEDEEKATPPAESPDSKAAKQGDEKSSAEKKSAGAKGADKRSGDKKASDKKAADKKSEKDAASKAAEDADIKFVKEGLKQFVHGTISFDEKNVLTINYDFRQRKDEVEQDFLPPISAKIPANFRWANWEEERWSSSSEAGVRISNDGAALLNLWFKDDVEASMDYYNLISFTKRQVCAIVLVAKNGQGIGNNFGGQCATFSGGAYKGGVPNTTETLVADKRAKFTLKVKDGTFEALLNGKSKKSAKYSPKSFASSRVGFVWSGNMAGSITSLSITGTLDFAAIAKEMRKPAAAQK